MNMQITVSLKITVVQCGYEKHSSYLLNVKESLRLEQVSPKGNLILCWWFYLWIAFLKWHFIHKFIYFETIAKGNSLKFNIEM